MPKYQREYKGRAIEKLKSLDSGEGGTYLISRMLFLADVKWEDIDKLINRSEFTNEMGRVQNKIFKIDND